MLREEQIDIRRQRAKAEQFHIENRGKNRVFSTYHISNPQSGGQYEVTIRGFEVGDNSCTCPDFRSNTLGTCKHIEAILEHVRAEAPPNLRQRKATASKPEIFVAYGEQVRLALRLPARHSDQLGALAARFFDADGFWKPGESFAELVQAVETAPEVISTPPETLEFIDRETDRVEFAQLEPRLLASLDAGVIPPELRDLLRVPLYDYQLRGAVFAACRVRSILGDDMGLGKTVQTMAAVELLARLRHIARVLVIAPASVKYQWESEIRRFTPRSVQIIDGGQEERKEQYAANTFYRLVNYEQVIRDLGSLNVWKPDLIVLDEAQRIKNWESKTSRAVKKLASRYAIVLTGTPLENKLEELYSIVQFVDDRRLGPAFQFLNEHRVLDEQGNLTGYRHLERIRERLAPIFLRRTRAEVLSQLPSRTDQTVYVELAPEQQAPYEEQRLSLARLVQKTYLSDLDRKRILACIVNLRLICGSTFLYDKATQVSPKLEEFAELITELMTTGGHKAVVFSQWEQMLIQASEILKKLGVGYTMLTGGLPGKERRDVLERFRVDPQCRVFLSTDAGGTGLNLQMADTVINLELPWNPAILEQRIARVHRMGQERPVRVIHLVARDTIEERVLRSVEQKKALFADLFEGDSDEVSFNAAGKPTFMESIRTLLTSAEPAAPPATTGSTGGTSASDPTTQLANASVQMLEALAAWATQMGPVGPELAARGAAALAALARCFPPAAPHE
jgi:SNF2 family DNA or RNA helicase